MTRRFPKARITDLSSVQIKGAKLLRGCLSPAQAVFAAMRIGAEVAIDEDSAECDPLTTELASHARDSFD